MSLNLCAGAALCLALVGSAAAAAPAAAAPTAPRAFAAAPRNLDGYSFEAYEVEFSKRYASAAERAAHEATFVANLRKVRAWNQAFAAGNQTWFAAINPFTDLTREQMKPRRGLSKAQRLAARRARVDAAATPLLNVRAEDLPVNVDWRDKGVVTDVKDQGQCGSCWTFSSSETIESHVAIKTGKLFVLSEQQIVSCAANPSQCGGTGGCEGATQEVAFNYTRDHVGLSLETSYPYEEGDSACDLTKVKPVAGIKGYYGVATNDALQLQAAIATIGPIAISIAASSDAFQNYGGGVLQYTNDWDVDHAVQAVGYGIATDYFNVGYWLVRNSWDSTWGDYGYVRVFRQTDGKTPEQCGTDYSPMDGDGCPGGPGEINVCGEIGILSDSSYPFGGHLVTEK